MYVLAPRGHNYFNNRIYVLRHYPAPIYSVCVFYDTVNNARHYKSKLTNEEIKALMVDQEVVLYNIYSAWFARAGRKMYWVREKNNRVQRLLGSRLRCLHNSRGDLFFAAFHDEETRARARGPRRTKNGDRIVMDSRMVMRFILSSSTVMQRANCAIVAWGGNFPWCARW